MRAHRNPLPTVDAVIFIEGRVVLIERKNPPHGWALPGGFVDEGESLEEAVVREALEETGLSITLDEQFHAYSDPARDPRRHTISVVFLAHAEGSPKGGDDAARAELWPLDALPETLAFDHGKILEDVRRYRAGGGRPKP